MNLNLKIVNPNTYKQWDQIISSFPESTFFHTSLWSKVLSTSYGYKPTYFIFTKNLKPIVVIPFMEISNPLKGKSGISLPFSDFCEPLFKKELEFGSIFDKISEYGKQSGWKTLTFTSYYIKDSFPISHYYYSHTLILQKDNKSILKSFRNSNIRNIKKALKSDIEILYKKSLGSIKHFYTLQCITRKKHGLPPQPFEFFLQIYENVLKKDKGIVILAKYKNDIIAGAIFFTYQDKALFKFGASKPEYQPLRPNNLVLWKGIQHFCDCGYKEFSFGKTEPDNEGLLQYKNGFNTEQKKLYVYKYHLRKNHFIQEKSKVYGIHNRIFQKTPIFILKIIGSVLYKYVG